VVRNSLTVHPISTSTTPTSANNPSPIPASKVASPDGTQDWKVYIDINRDFGLRYPQDMKINNDGTFYKGNREGWEGSDFKFSASSGSETFITQSLNKDNFADLYSSPNGVLKTTWPNGTNHPNDRITVTKVESLTINGYSAVHFTDVYTGSTQLPPDYFDEYIIKGNKGYYFISQGPTTSQSKLDQYASDFKLVVNSFTEL
jgi:hypothetical protein